MKKQNLRTVSLIVATFTYLLIGAAIFGSLESEHESRQKEALELIELIIRRKYNITEEDYTVLTTTVIKSVPHKAGIQWRFLGALYFATTVVTTIGYGHSTPSTTAGRGFCMLYALIGIPLGLVMFQSIGERLNTLVDRSLRWFKRCCCKSRDPEVTQKHTVMVVLTLSTILMTSMAAVFAKYERWEYFDALYYCFITLTTIGFGDYVALQKDSALQSKPEYVALSLIFILFGLSVVSSAVNLLVLKFLTLNTEDERRDEQLRYTAAMNPIQLEGDVITSAAGKLEYARKKRPALTISQAMAHSSMRRELLAANAAHAAAGAQEAAIRRRRRLETGTSETSPSDGSNSSSSSSSSLAGAHNEALEEEEELQALCDGQQRLVPFGHGHWHAAMSSPNQQAPAAAAAAAAANFRPFRQRQSRLTRSLGGRPIDDNNESDELDTQLEHEQQQELDELEHDQEALPDYSSSLPLARPGHHYDARLVRRPPHFSTWSCVGHHLCELADHERDGESSQVPPQTRSKISNEEHLGLSGCASPAEFHHHHHHHHHHWKRRHHRQQNVPSKPSQNNSSSELADFCQNSTNETTKGDYNQHTELAFCLPTAGDELARANGTGGAPGKHQQLAGDSHQGACLTPTQQQERAQKLHHQASQQALIPYVSPSSSSSIGTNTRRQHGATGEGLELAVLSPRAGSSSSSSAVNKHQRKDQTQGQVFTFTKADPLHRRREHPAETLIGGLLEDCDCCADDSLGHKRPVKQRQNNEQQPAGSCSLASRGLRSGAQGQWPAEQQRLRPIRQRGQLEQEPGRRPKVISTLSYTKRKPTDGGPPLTCPILPTRSSSPPCCRRQLQIAHNQSGGAVVGMTRPPPMTMPPPLGNRSSCSCSWLSLGSNSISPMQCQVVIPPPPSSSSKNKSTGQLLLDVGNLQLHKHHHLPARTLQQPRHGEKGRPSTFGATPPGHGNIFRSAPTVHPMPMSAPAGSAAKTSADAGELCRDRSLGDDEQDYERRPISDLDEPDSPALSSVCDVRRRRHDQSRGPEGDKLDHCQVGTRKGPELLANSNPLDDEDENSPACRCEAEEARAESSLPQRQIAASSAIRRQSAGNSARQRVAVPKLVCKCCCRHAECIQYALESTATNNNNNNEDPDENNNNNNIQLVDEGDLVADYSTPADQVQVEAGQQAPACGNGAAICDRETRVSSDESRGAPRVLSSQVSNDQQQRHKSVVGEEATTTRSSGEDGTATARSEGGEPPPGTIEDQERVSSGTAVELGRDCNLEVDVQRWRR